MQNNNLVNISNSKSKLDTITLNQMSNVQVNNKIPNENFIKSSSNNNLKQGKVINNQINGNKTRENI